MRTFWAVTVLSMLGSSMAAMLAERVLLQRITLLGSFAGLQLSHNAGVAFGITFPDVLQDIFILLALLFVAYVALRTAKTILSQVAFGLVIGGGLANVYDRFIDGVVTDYFQVGSFPIFNVADSCVTIGVVLLLIDTVMMKKAK